LRDKSFITKGFTAVLTVIFVGTNCIFAHASETNFWKERKKNFELASLPPVHNAFGPISPPSSLSKSISSGISNNKIKRWLKKDSSNETLKEVLKALPAQYGSIRGVSIPGKESSEKIVIHIQDIHMNLEAQKNIGTALQELIHKGQVDLVALEGAFDPIDVSLIRRYPYPESVAHVADYLLREHKISGPIHTAFTLRLRSGQAFPPITGIDDKGHYESNVKAVVESSKLKIQKSKKIQNQKFEIQKRKEEIFNKNLWDFDQMAEARRTGVMGLGDYAQALSPFEKDPSLNFSLFIEAVGLENTLNTSRVEHERSILLSQLLHKMDKKTTSRLMETTLSSRMGQLSHADFSHTLQDLCRSHAVPLSKFPAMKDYLHYILLADSIDAGVLLKDIHELEGTVYKKLTQTEEEQNLLIESRKLFLTGKLIAFALTPEEWEEVKTETGESKSDPFVDFYRHAEARDQAITENLLKAMEETKADVAVLVTGGFHAKGIKKLLGKDTENGAPTLISFVPKISKVDTQKGTAYLSVFTRFFSIYFEFLFRFINRFNPQLIVQK